MDDAGVEERPKSAVWKRSGGRGQYLPGSALVGEFHRVRRIRHGQPLGQMISMLWGLSVMLTLRVRVDRRQAGPPCNKRVRGFLGREEREMRGSE